MVLGEVVGQLGDVVVEELLEVHARPGHAVLDGHRVALLQVSLDTLQRLLEYANIGVGLELLHIVGVVQIVVHVLGLVLEEAAEQVPRPL